MTPPSPNTAVEPEEEVSALIDLLHRTSARLEELTLGEVDAVTDSEGRPFLLRHAQEHLRQIEAARQAAILDALPAHVAVLDPSGRIISVNKAWRRFGSANGLLSPDSGVGDNYLAVCDKALGESALGAERIARGILAVLSGSETSFSLEYACHSATEKRWFLMTVNPLSRTFRAGAVIMHVDVTAEKHAAEDLVESETRFRQMAKHINDVFFLQNLDASIIYYVSPAYERIWGRSCESVYARPASWTDAVHPDDQHQIGEQLAKGDVAFDYEFRIIRPDGEVRWIHVRGVPVLDETGTPYRTAGMASDITERKAAEDALRRSEEEFRTLAESMPQMVWITRPDGWNIYFSQQWMDYTGLTLEETLGQGWVKPFHPEDQARAWDAWAKATTEVGTYSIECRLRRADGVYRWWLIRGVPVQDAKGAILKWFGTCTDIHDLKEAEREIARSNRVYAMLSGISTVIVRVRDRDELFKEACKIAVDAGGFRMSLIAVVDPQTAAIVPVAAAGKDEGLLAEVASILGNPETAPKTMLARAIRDKTPAVSNDTVNDPRVKLPRTYLEAGVRSLAVTPLVISGEAIGVLALYSSEVDFFHAEEMELLKQLANDIAFCMGVIRSRAHKERADEALVASLKEKEALLKEVHHRVKNNMQVITSLLRLEANRIDHPTTRAVLKDMQNRILAMAALHEALYRSNSFAQVDLGSYLRELTSQLKRSLVASPGQITFRLQLVAVSLNLDQAVPCGLIVNELVSNALKHGFPDGRSGEVRVETAWVPEGALRLRVSDDGIGLRPDFGEIRLKSLGLQLVADLARQLRGGLVVGPGPQAVFEVTFPPEGGVFEVTFRPETAG